MEESKQSTRPRLPEPWEALHHAYQARYQRTTAKTAPEVLVEVCNGMPIPVAFEDAVLEGMARKASATMSSTCQSCGGSGRRRFVHFGYRVRCAVCHAKSELAEEINEVTAFAMSEADPRDPYDLAVWHEHELSRHFQAAMPHGIWRSTQIPGGKRLRYLCREDLRRLSPWLLKLAALLALDGLDAQIERAS